MTDHVLNQRIDDLIELCGVYGSKGSRADVIRRAIFALPTEDQEHLSRLLQYGGLRYREANGQRWSEDALAECEGLLGFWHEDADRAALVNELNDLRRRLTRVVGEIDKARKVAAMEHAEWWR